MHTLQSNRISHKLKEGKMREREISLTNTNSGMTNHFKEHKEGFNDTKSKALIKHNVN